MSLLRRRNISTTKAITILSHSNTCQPSILDDVMHIEQNVKCIAVFQKKKKRKKKKEKKTHKHTQS
jgi:hypothetical protein